MQIPASVRRHGGICDGASGLGRVVCEGTFNTLHALVGLVDGLGHSIGKEFYSYHARKDSLGNRPFFAFRHPDMNGLAVKSARIRVLACAYGHHRTSTQYCDAVRLDFG